MAVAQSLLRTLCGVLFLISCAQALKFDLDAHRQGDKKAQRCIRNFVASNTLVVVTATVDGYKGDGMMVNMQVS